MRSLLLLVTILIGADNNVCAEDVNVHVLVHEPLVVLVRRFNLPTVCATDARIEACTATVGQRLSCRCERATTGWHMTASAQFIPVMYVMGPDYVQHEREHIRDLRRSLTAYVSGLEERQFESETVCEREAAELAASFPATMDRFKDDSNAARHPGYRRQVRTAFDVPAR